MIGMSATSTWRASRFSRWGVLSAAFIIASALLISAWSNHASVSDMSRTLILGQRGALFAGIRAQLRRVAGPPEAVHLDEVRADYAEQGLRYLALVLPDRVIESGVPVGPPLAPGNVRPLPPRSGGELASLVDLGARVRAMHRSFPGHHPPPGPGAQGPPFADHHRSPRPPPGPPPIVFEFEPILARQLLARARRTLWVNAAIALALLIGALLAFRWLRRQEDIEAHRVRERHLATLGEMSAVLAHEIRNPLSSLKGHAQLLAEFLPDGKPRAKAELVVREAVRIELLTTGLLDFVRTGDIDRRPSDPADIARAAIAEVVGHGMSEQAEPPPVSLDTERAPPTWSLDPERMRQVLCNLVRNGLQATERVEPSASSRDCPLVSVRVASSGDRLSYQVRDIGPGIPAGKESAIFAAFHTSRVRGTGLGLAVAKRIVDRHGGTIEAENHPAGGALFRIEIPK